MVTLYKFNVNEMFALEVVEHFRLNGSSLTMSSFTSTLIFSQCIFSCFPASDLFSQNLWATLIYRHFFLHPERKWPNHPPNNKYTRWRETKLPSSFFALRTCESYLFVKKPVDSVENGVNRWKEAHLGLINIAEFPNFSKQLMVFFFNKRILFISMIFLLP